MIRVSCDLKPKEKECNLMEAHECFEKFDAYFWTYRGELVAKKNPKAIAICG
jgi:hypothetical protein